MVITKDVYSVMCNDKCNNGCISPDFTGIYFVCSVRDQGSHSSIVMTYVWPHGRVADNCVPRNTVYVHCTCREHNFSDVSSSFSTA